METHPVGIDRTARHFEPKTSNVSIVFTNGTAMSVEVPVDIASDLFTAYHKHKTDNRGIGGTADGYNHSGIYHAKPLYIDVEFRDITAIVVY